MIDDIPREDFDRYRQLITQRDELQKKWNHAPYELVLGAAAVPIFSTVHWTLGTATGVGIAYALYKDIKAGIELQKVKTEISKLEQKLDEL